MFDPSTVDIQRLQADVQAVKPIFLALLGTCGSLIGVVIWAVKTYRTAAKSLSETVIAKTIADMKLATLFNDVDALKAWRALCDARIIELETQSRVAAARCEAQCHD